MMWASTFDVALATGLSLSLSGSTPAGLSLSTWRPDSGLWGPARSQLANPVRVGNDTQEYIMISHHLNVYQ